MDAEQPFKEIENFSNYETVLNAIDEDIGIVSRDHPCIFENSHCIGIHGHNAGKRRRLLESNGRIYP
ncbi:MAG: hypothetical protein ABFS09_03980 [Thermodesulfobacteriota bacterium]